MIKYLSLVVLPLFVALSLAHPAILNGTETKSGGKIWALLVAGSNGWDNYRHQADVCHAYQVLKRHGVPEDQIITMMYDDIAKNSANPTKGVIINHPKGQDVYGGVKIDYSGKDVDPTVFLNVLQGNKEALVGKGNGKVIDSGPNDHIFVNFVDHGAPGLIAFPDSELHAKPLISALTSMFQKKRYAQMVLYVEACESGSMFNKILPKNVNIFVTTAANAVESSYAVYYDDLRGTYLGDVYSVNWMENSDASDLTKETLSQQFATVKKETNTSHVMEYGDLSIASEPVGDFQGETEGVEAVLVPKVPFDAVPSPDVELHIIQKAVASSNSEEDRLRHTLRLEAELQTRLTIVTEMKAIISAIAHHNDTLAAALLSTRSDVINFDCYEPAVNYYSHVCRKLSAHPFALRQLYALQNACNVQPLPIIFEAMEQACHQ